MSSFTQEMKILQVEKQMLNYSTKIYDDDNGSNFFYSDKETDLQVGIYLSDKITVAFRGTESMKDKMYDLNATKTKLSNNIYVHEGFYNQLLNSKIYKRFHNNLMLLISEHNDCEIYITGHSLGGALATLFGYILANEINKKINIISFASPRVGNYSFKRAFEKKSNLKHIRIVVSNDPIPYFPLINYYHVGKIKNLKVDEWFPNINNHSTKVYKKHLEDY